MFMLGFLFTLGCYFRMHSRDLGDGLHGTYFEAASALDAGHLIDGEFFFTAAADAGNRTLAGTQGTTDTAGFIYIVMH